MQVLKFGGTSVANADNMSKVVSIVSKALDRDRTILVCSAISKCTDTLIQIGHRAADHDSSYLDLIHFLHERHYEIIEKLLPASSKPSTKKSIDAIFAQLKDVAEGVYLLRELSYSSLETIQSFGELLSTKIIAAKFSSLGYASKWIDSREIIKTSEGHNVNTKETYENIAQMVESHSLVSLFIVPGFIASDASGRTTTLGRGGSDYSASIYAVGSKARVLEIWTDVTGMMTTNPKICPTARTISNISYRAALELSHFGAKVIYPPTIQPVVAEGIPIFVKNTFDPDAFGTLIENNPPRSPRGNLIGISNSDNIALISLEGSGMVGIPGFSSRLFAALSENDINIILITQASSVHTMSIAISEKDAQKAKAAADSCFAYEIAIGKLNPLKVETGFSIVCLVGDDVLGKSGATGRMLAALGRHAIPVRATAQGSSERNISVIVASEHVDNAIRHIHNEFFDKTFGKDLNLYIAGYGTVGKALVDIIRENAAQIAERTGQRIHICGLSNSRKYVFNPEGIELETIDEALKTGEEALDDAFFERIGHVQQENSIFVDCTASTEIANKYIGLFGNGFSVVTCNKLIFSASYPQFLALQNASKESGKFLRFETTVGAALPILQTISMCINSGDRIHKIQAVLSGTLNYLFSNYKGSGFGDLVLDAKKKGYTEPDPRNDLSGKDVLRKLLILARLSGVELEESDVKLQSVPEEEEVQKLYEAAAAEGKVLRYIASIEEGRNARIAIEAVGPDSPFYNLVGTDNAALITTDYYPSPLVIQGAGAGARQTAGGVLNDILK